MLWAQSTTKDYIRVENKLQSISKLFIPRVIILQDSFSQTTTQTLSTILERKPRLTITHVLEPIFTFLTQHGNLCPAGWPIYSVGLPRNWYKPQLTQEKLGRGFGKHAGEWTGRIEISKEEIPGGKCSRYGYIYWPTSGFKGEPFSSLFSTDGTLISAYAAPHCRVLIIWAFSVILILMIQ